MPEIVLESRAGTLWWREEGFWHYRMREHHEISAEEINAFLDAVERRLPFVKAPLLIDRTYSYSTSFGAMLAFRERASHLVSAIAYYVPTDHAESASTFAREEMLSEWESVVFFRSLDQAIEWLLVKAQGNEPESREATTI